MNGRFGLPDGAEIASNPGRSLPHPMTAMMRNVFRWPAAAGLAAFCLAASAPGQTAPIRLEVDATEATRCVLHARLQIWVHPGPLTLLYPKWLPGEHAPDGPINDLTGIRMSAGGKPVEWRRDPVDMCAFHVDILPGADMQMLEVTLDALLPTGGGVYSAGVSSTARLLDLSWNEVLLYPQGSNALKTEYAPVLRLPHGCKFGTALPGVAAGDRVQFLPVTLETLVDSPVICGEYYRAVPLGTIGGAPHELDIVADSAAALEIKPEDTQRFSHLSHEANALFGAHHYRDYHFLLTASDTGTQETHRYLMRLTSDNTAEVKMVAMSMPPGMPKPKPWKLSRVGPSAITPVR